MSPGAAIGMHHPVGPEGARQPSEPKGGIEAESVRTSPAAKPESGPIIPTESKPKK
jgi:hypothetical protein